MRDDLRRVVVLGPPGAGKDTMADKLVDVLDVPKVVTGDLLRDAVEEGVEEAETIQEHLEQGGLVPNRVSIPLTLQRLQDCDTGFVLDGFPRDVEQAEALEGIGLDAVLYLEVDEEEAVERLKQRRVCKECGMIYNVETDPPRETGTCDECGGKLVQREDDKPDVIRERFNVYREKTMPVREFYKKKDVLVPVDANADIPVVWNRVQDALNLDT